MIRPSVELYLKAPSKLDNFFFFFGTWLPVASRRVFEFVVAKGFEEKCMILVRLIKAVKWIYKCNVKSCEEFRIDSSHMKGKF